MNNTKLNPIYKALDGIDEDIAARVAVKRRKINKPLKIAVISVAAAMLLGTTAAAATLGEHPIVKLNGKSVTPRFSSYVDDNGWKIDTTVIEYPADDTIGYSPVGEVRGVYNENGKTLFEDVKHFDELGIELDNITSQLRISFNAEKEGEIPIHFIKLSSHPNYHYHESGNADGTEIKIELWQDPIQAAKDALAEKAYARMSVDDKIELSLREYYDFGHPEYGGYAHPSMRDIFTEDAHGSYGSPDVINFSGFPSTIAGKYFDYTFDQPDGFTEKEGIQIIQYDNHYYEKIDGINQCTYDGDPMIIQQIFIYTMTDSESGKDVKFTVWRSAEEKDVDTSCFKFDYGYIPLKNGTEARLHQSADYNYIVEFEKDGAAYALVCGLDRELVNRVLENMNLL